MRRQCVSETVRLLNTTTSAVIPQLGLDPPAADSSRAGGGCYVSAACAPESRRTTLTLQMLYSGVIEL